MSARDTSQLTTNLLGPGVVEKIFKDAATTANTSQFERENRFGSSSAVPMMPTSTKDDDAQSVTSAGTATATSSAAGAMNVSKDGRLAANRAANISVLMLGALAADSKIMDVPSNFHRVVGGGNSNNRNNLFGSIASNNIINADNVFSALSKAGFGHLVEPCKKAVLEEVDTSEEMVLGVRRQRAD